MSKKVIINALTPLLLSAVCASAFASPDGAHRKMYPLYRIKPNTPSYAPSGYSPVQIRKAYGFTKLKAQGEGQVIAIIDAFDNPNAESDLNVFSSTFGLPSCTTANGCFEKVYASGTKPSPSKGWGTEIALDIQWAHATAPKAKIMLVEAANSYTDSLNTAIKVAIEKGATVVSMSYGGSEFSSESVYDKMYQVSGVEFVASAGDGGTGVICPACSPYVLAVGGTSLKVDTSGNYLSESAWAGSGGGLSAYQPQPAYQKGFPIPENTTNKRGVPDVAYNANPNTGFSVYNTYQNPGWLVIGGTSAGAPQWAGVLAVAKSASPTKLENMHALIYNIARLHYSNTFNDITTGTNGSCGYYCSAQVGYDYVTGLGTPKVDALVDFIATGGLDRK
ncbi:MAG: S53 family peptidase [Legionella sp.]|nr:S53 family peptidase [Legionella sp.]